MKFINLILLLLPGLLIGQQLYPLIEVTDSVHFLVVAKDNQLALEVEDITNQLDSKDDFLSIASVELNDADLIISYHFRGIKKGFAYTVAASLLLRRGEKTVLKPGPGYASDPEAGRETNNTRQLIWMDFGEKAVTFGQRYTLLVRKILLGAVQCMDERPEFGVKQQWPHYAVVGLGAALIGVGQIYRKQKEDNYNTYLEYFREGLPGDSALSFLTDAQEEEKVLKALTFTGLALLGADAITFAVRHFSNKKQQKLFDKYCKGVSLYISPPLQRPTPGVTGFFAGCRIVWAF